ncbi:MAG TPA: hypothetical protein VJ142_00505 [Candidatus Nanoarchaeia archaeon]|nr:hypothetical protein [Candidatus Nanoarchaeia archaeon]
MDKKVILYIVLGIVVLALLLFTIFPGMIHAVKDSGIVGNNVLDKCKPAPGYTEEAWREHMGHHPNIYAECLS